MPYPPSNAPSDATKGSTHSSAIMTIPERWEYNHSPLSRMGTPQNRPETPRSDDTARPNSRNQVLPYQNAPGPLAVRDQIVPVSSAPSGSSNMPSRQSSRPEIDGGMQNALQWVAEQQALQRDNRSQDSTTSDSTIRPPQTQSRQPGQRRSSNNWVAPMLVLGAAAVLANVRVGDSSHSRRPDRDREDNDRPSRKYRAPTYEDDDSDNDTAGRSTRDRDGARDGNSRSHRSRRSRNQERDEDRRRSGR